MEFPGNMHIYKVCPSPPDDNKIHFIQCNSLGGVAFTNKRWTGRGTDKNIKTLTTLLHPMWNNKAYSILITLSLLAIYKYCEKYILSETRSGCMNPIT